MNSIWYLLAAGATMGTVALFAFLWGVKNGAFENAEDAKYIVFRDEEDERVEYALWPLTITAKSKT